MRNRQQAGEARKSRRFEREEAGKSRAFSERMRNTSWQAGIADMEAAGVNPALAYSQGGASSPMGDAGSGAQATVEDVLSPGISSAQVARRLDVELKAMKAQTRVTRAKATYDEGVNAAYGISTDARGRMHFDLSMPHLKDMVHANVSNAKSIARMNELNIPGALNIARFEGGAMGQGTRTIRSLLQTIFGSGGAFKAR